MNLNMRRRRLRGSFSVESLEERTLLTVLTVTNLGDSGPGTLRAELAQADAMTGPVSDGVITVEMEQGSLTVLQNPIEFGSTVNNITIQGEDSTIVAPANGSAAFIIQEQTTQLFVVEPDGTITPTAEVVPLQPVNIDGLTFVGQQQLPTASSSATIVNQTGAGTSLVDCQFEGINNGVSTGGGTAIENGIGAQMNFVDGSIVNYDIAMNNIGGILNLAGIGAKNNNIAHNSLAGIINTGTLSITNTYMYANGGAIGHPGGYGSAIENNGGTLTISNSELYGNDGPYNSGSAIASSGGTVAIDTGTSIDENIGAPAVFTVNTALTVDHGNISNNFQSAIVASGGSANVNNSVFNGNWTAGSEAVISLQNTSANFTDNTIKGNITNVPVIVSDESFTGSGNDIKNNFTNTGLYPFGFLVQPPIVVAPPPSPPSPPPVTLPITPVQPPMPLVSPVGLTGPTTTPAVIRLRRFPEIKVLRPNKPGTKLIIRARSHAGTPTRPVAVNFMADDTVTIDVFAGKKLEESQVIKKDATVQIIVGKPFVRRLRHAVEALRVHLPRSI